MELLLFTDRAGPRFRYVADMIFGRLLPCPFRVTTDREEFLRHSGARLNYSQGRLTPEEVFLPAGSLLQERGVRSLSPEVFSHQGLPAFFRQEIPRADLPFDLPALVFYLLSRYEEYLPFLPDEHGRFSGDQSLGFRAGFLRQPLVDQWSERLAALLARRFPAWRSASSPFSFEPTYDVDLAWAFRHRGLIRQLGGALRDGGAGRYRDLFLRAQVLAGRREDPFFTFGYLDRLHDQYGLRPHFFFLLADPGPFDRNVPADHPALRELIRSVSRRYPVGIHPSYRSSADTRALHREIGRLRAITDAPVRAARQHFLKLHLPGTYRRLLEASIRADYSMGYADQPGFRAGIARPFPWYDLEGESVTELLIHPFQVMDVTLKNYLGLSPEESIEFVSELIAPVRQCGGVFSTLWHNSSFSIIDGWENWRPVYEKTIQTAIER